MAPPNPHHLGVGKLVEEAIQNINPFDKTNQAQVRAQIKRDHQGEVVWMVIDPNNLAHRRASEMGFPERPTAQKAGAEVLIKVRPGIVAPTLGFVSRNHQSGQEDNIAFHGGTYGDFLRLALRNFDYRDGANCRSANAIMLIWLARRRLYHWYSLQEAVAWDQSVVLEDEAVFQPRRPFRSYFQMFGSAIGEGMGMENATAGDNYYPRWLGG
ncbi:hypothetical protein BCON_0507g00040 [Botryotinia convoluta]|uniref:Uncharacterized protein n=1 Tax=Botryotinia convoluta TaxID=54673 RepID=A0A4Z1H5T4_9HELO|nr:hypothetical protein BCON_0507g00040 [Botryotinia convoluta]